MRRKLGIVCRDNDVAMIAEFHRDIEREREN